MKLWVWGEKKTNYYQCHNKTKNENKTPLKCDHRNFYDPEVSHSLVPDVTVSPEPMDLDQIRCKYDWW